jgi:hypothetical protein
VGGVTDSAAGGGGAAVTATLPTVTSESSPSGPHHNGESRDQDEAAPPVTTPSDAQVEDSGIPGAALEKRSSANLAVATHREDRTEGAAISYAAAVRQDQGRMEAPV